MSLAAIQLSGDRRIVEFNYWSEPNVRERKRWVRYCTYIYVCLTFILSLTPATIELAVRIVEYVRRERPRLNREVTTCRNNNEISFCSSREARWDSSDMKVREKFQPRLDAPNSARLSGQRETGEWYLGTPMNGTFCQRLSESLTSCDSTEICKRFVRGRR